MDKKIIKILLIILCIFLVIYVLFNKFKIHEQILVKLYPKTYSEYVEKYSEEYNVDSLLIYAIIKAESNFKPDVTSKSNAIGLMQLMNTTAEDTAKKLGMEYNQELLKNPETNIQIGTKYFSTLNEKYKNIPVALTAYNAGSGNVDKWIGENIIAKDGTDAENIPYRETNNYVRKILRDYAIYEKIYNK